MWMRSRYINVVFDSINRRVASLLGVGDTDTDLGTFPGSTISDSASVKGALTQLEGAVEAASALQNAAQTGIADAGGHFSASDVEGALQEIAVGSGNQQDVLGVAAGADHLGQFPGTVISDDVSIKTALTELEAAVSAPAAAVDLAVGTHDANSLEVANSGGSNVSLPTASNTQAGIINAATHQQIDWISKAELT